MLMFIFYITNGAHIQKQKIFKSSNLERQKKAWKRIGPKVCFHSETSKV